MYYFISSLNIFAKIIKHQFKIIQLISSIVSDLDYDNETKIQSELAFYNGFTISTFFCKKYNLSTNFACNKDEKYDNLTTPTILISRAIKTIY